MCNKEDKLVMGIDLSTQSLTLVIIDIKTGKIVSTVSQSFVDDVLLKKYGLDPETMILPNNGNKAEQPVLVYLESLDLALNKLKSENIDFSKIAVINHSSQQHGHLYLNKSSELAFDNIKSGKEFSSLVENFRSSFSKEGAPIWKSSDTQTQSNEIRDYVGDSKEMISLSGSDSPLRFTGSVIRKIGQDEPANYENSKQIHLISSFLSALLTGNKDSPIDFGNASGTSLMDYRQKCWSPKLLQAVANGLPGGVKALIDKLPPLASPNQSAGKIAPWFVKKYGFSKDTTILNGSGDNPQTKVLADGDLLSLGTSFVYMVESGGALDYTGSANAMVDGTNREFIFGCRTNGAIVWDRIRALHNINDPSIADSYITDNNAASILLLWQPDSESFPLSSKIELVREEKGLSASDDYNGIIDSTLSLLYLNSLKLSTGDNNLPLYVTGGPSKSNLILKRIAAIWNRPVVALQSVGAGLGAAVAGVEYFHKINQLEFNRGEFVKPYCLGEKTVAQKEVVAKYRGKNGYFSKLEQFFNKHNKY